MSRPPGPKAHPRYIAILALAAAAILVIGGLLRPRSDETSLAPTLPASELARLQQANQRRALLDQTEYFRTVATDIGPAVTYLPDRGVAAVAWGMDRLVTVVLPANEPWDRQAHGVMPPRTRPVVAVDTVVTGATTPARSDALVASGDWIVAVWDGPTGRAFVPGRYMGATHSTCGMSEVREVLTTLPLSRSMAGAGLFDLYGGLVGLVVPCGGRLAGITVTAVDMLLADAATVPGRLLDLYGLEAMAVPKADLQSEEPGVIVRAVWDGEAAAASGLRPGDTIVGLNGAPVASELDLAPIAAAVPEAAPVLSVVRGDGTREDVRLDRAVETNASDGVVIETVPDGSAAARAGLLPGDRIVQADGRPIRTAAQAEALTTRGGSGTGARVELERNGRRWMVVWP